MVYGEVVGKLEGDPLGELHGEMMEMRYEPPMEWQLRRFMGKMRYLHWNSQWVQNQEHGEDSLMASQVGLVMEKLRDTEWETHWESHCGPEVECRQAHMVVSHTGLEIVRLESDH